MLIDDFEDKVVKCTSLIEEEQFVSFSVFPWENPWRTPTIHGKMSTKKSHKLTNIVNGPEKTSWPFPQFTTSANKGEVWECSAYILPTSNIDKDPPFLFLNLKKLSPLQKAMSLIWVSGIHCLQKLSWLIAPEKLCIFSNPYLSQIGIVSSGLYLSTSWPRTKKPSAEKRGQSNITTFRRSRGRHLNGKVCRLWIPAGSPWMDPPVLGSVPFSTSCPFT